MNKFEPSGPSTCLVFAEFTGANVEPVIKASLDERPLVLEPINGC